MELPSGVDIVSGAGTNEVIVNISKTAVSGDVTVFARNSFGDGDPSPTFAFVIEPIPPADTGIDRAVCLNETTVLGGDDSDPLATSYAWTSVPEDTNISDATVWNPTVQPLQTTIYTLTVTYANGATNSNEVEITVNPLPTVEVINDTTVCENETISIGGSGNPALEYSWTSVPAGFTSSVADPTLFTADLTTTREYFLTVTNPATGCTNTDSVIITVEQLPVISAGPANDTICETLTTYPLDQATSSIPNNADVNYRWYTANGNPNQFSASNILNPNFTPSTDDITNGSVVLFLEATSVNFCSATSVTSQIELFIEPSPIATIAPVDSPICGDDTLEITSTTANGTILWTPLTPNAGLLSAYNIPNPTYTPSETDIANGEVTFKLAVSSNNSCGTIAEDEITIFITEPHSVSIPTPLEICENETITLNANASNYSTIRWETLGDGVFNPTNGVGNTSPEYIPGTQDIANGFVNVKVIVTGNQACGTEKEADSRININKNAEVNAGPGGILCEGVNQLANISASNFESILWTSSGDGTFNDNTSSTPSYTPGEADLTNGQVILTITAQPLNSCQGPATDDVVFAVHKAPVANAGPDQTICEGESVILGAATSLNANSIAWTHNGSGSFNDPTVTNPTYLPTQQDINNGVVRLTMTTEGKGVCDDDSDFMLVNIVKKPTVDTGPDQTICQGRQFKLMQQHRIMTLFNGLKQEVMEHSLMMIN